MSFDEDRGPEFKTNFKKIVSAEVEEVTRTILTSKWRLLTRRHTFCVLPIFRSPYPRAISYFVCVRKSVCFVGVFSHLRLYTISFWAMRRGKAVKSATRYACNARGRNVSFGAETEVSRRGRMGEILRKNFLSRGTWTRGAEKRGCVGGRPVGM